MTDQATIDEIIYVVIKVALGKNLKCRAHKNNQIYLRRMKEGYLVVSNEGEFFTTYTLTNKGMRAVMRVEDNYISPAHFYPLIVGPGHVQDAKKIVEPLLAEKP